MLDLNEIIRKLINTARLEMFIDKAGVLILDDKKKECQTMFIGDETDQSRPMKTNAYSTMTRLSISFHKTRS